MMERREVFVIGLYVVLSLALRVLVVFFNSNSKFSQFGVHLILGVSFVIDLIFFIIALVYFSIWPKII